MLAKLLLLFIAIPIAEMAILVWLGSQLGFWPTMALIIVTGIAGASLARAAGVHVVAQIRAEIAAGRMPVDHLLDGLLVLVGGVVLLTPGILTDIAGLLLLVPASRAVVRRFVRRRFQQHVETRRIEIIGMDGRPVDVSHYDRRPADRAAESIPGGDS